MSPTTTTAAPPGDSRTPLLGHATGSASDNAVPTSSAQLLGRNLFGDVRALLTQIGCLLLLGTVLAIIIPNPAGLFSYHPPAQSLAILLFAQGVLTLQPTSTRNDKKKGLALHQIFQIVGLLAAAAGVSIMIANKVVHSAPHFTSWHGKFGLVTSILLILQAILGALMAHSSGQALLGGEGRAKSLWKYHRMSGYAILPLALLTAALATSGADWVVGHSSRVQRAAMTGGLALVAVGLWSRMSLKKLGFKQ